MSETESKDVLALRNTVTSVLMPTPAAVGCNEAAAVQLLPVVPLIEIVVQYARPFRSVVTTEVGVAPEAGEVPLRDRLFTFPSRLVRFGAGGIVFPAPYDNKFRHFQFGIRSIARCTACLPCLPRACCI